MWGVVVCSSSNALPKVKDSYLSCEQLSCYNSSETMPRKRSFRERASSSKSKKLYLSLPDAARTLYDVFKSNNLLIKIIGRYGGCTLHIPAKWPPVGQSANFKGHVLRRVLSPEQMRLMVAHYGGTDLYVPKCSKYILQLRNASIINEFSKKIAKGKSTGDVVQWLARRYRLSDRRIWHILKHDLEDETV